MKVIIVLSLILAVAYAGVPGAPRSLEGDDLKTAKDLLTTTFAKLTTEDYYHNYQVVNVKSASRQEVPGTLYKYVVDVSDGSVTRECIVEILKRPWLEQYGTRLTLKVKDDVKIVRTY